MMSSAVFKLCEVSCSLEPSCAAKCRMNTAGEAARGRIAPWEMNSHVFTRLSMALAAYFRNLDLEPEGMRPEEGSYLEQEASR